MSALRVEVDVRRARRLAARRHVERRHEDEARARRGDRPVRRLDLGVRHRRDAAELAAAHDCTNKMGRREAMQLEASAPGKEGRPRGERRLGNARRFPSRRRDRAWLACGSWVSSGRPNPLGVLGTPKRRDGRTHCDAPTPPHRRRPPPRARRDGRGARAARVPTLLRAGPPLHQQRVRGLQLLQEHRPVRLPAGQVRPMVWRAPLRPRRALPRLPLLPEPGAARAATLRGVVPRERAVQIVQVLGLRVVPRAEERRRRLGADPAAGAEGRLRAGVLQAEARLLPGARTGDAAGRSAAAAAAAGAAADAGAADAAAAAAASPAGAAAGAAARPASRRSSARRPPRPRPGATPSGTRTSPLASAKASQRQAVGGRLCARTTASTARARAASSGAGRPTRRRAPRRRRRRRPTSSSSTRRRCTRRSI